MKDAASDFRDFEEQIYLNCAFQGPLPGVALRAAEKALERERAPQLILESDFFDVPDRYRSGIAALIGSRADDIAVTNSATDGVMPLVNGLDWCEGDEVILPVGEFPANRFPWLSLQRRGVVIREIDLPPGAEGLERLESSISDRTLLIATSWLSYRTGYRMELAKLSEMCRLRGVLLVVDGSQALGGLSFDISETPCDLLVCAGYKWLLGPYGTGFAWVRPELGERLALGNVNWFSIEGARDFNRLSECRLEYVPGAIRFDVNETASFITVETATASLEYLSEITVGAVEEHVRTLLDRLIDGLPGGFQPVGDLRQEHRSNILCIAGESDEATEAAYARLVENGVVTSLREGAIRISPHIYNTAEEIDSLLDLLRELPF